MMMMMTNTLTAVEALQALEEALDVATNVVPSSLCGYHWDDGYINAPQTVFGQIYDQYANAMAKRRPDSVLSYEGFDYYTSQENVYIFEYKGNCLVGQYDINTNTFKVSHFAPKTQRGGIQAIKELKKQPFNVVFAVTEDLAGMLEKLDYIYVTSMPMFFRDDIVIKDVYANTLDAYDVVCKYISDGSF